MGSDNCKTWVPLSMLHIDGRFWISLNKFYVMGTYIPEYTFQYTF